MCDKHTDETLRHELKKLRRTLFFSFNSCISKIRQQLLRFRPIVYETAKVPYKILLSLLAEMASLMIDFSLLSLNTFKRF